jgi:hypothetical protein
MRGSLEFLLGDADDLLLKALRSIGTSLLAAEVREKAVPGNATQPGSEVASTTEIAKVSSGCDEHLLRQIIRLRDVVELPGTITAQHQFIPPHHLQIQIRLTAFDAVEQCGEIGFVGVHAVGVLAFLTYVPGQFPISQKIVFVMFF